MLTHRPWDQSSSTDDNCKEHKYTELFNIGKTKSVCRKKDDLIGFLDSEFYVTLNTEGIMEYIIAP